MALSKEDILKGSVVCDRVTGVYFLIHGDEIVYVGQSVDFSLDSKYTGCQARCLIGSTTSNVKNGSLAM